MFSATGRRRPTLWDFLAPKVDKLSPPRTRPSAAVAVRRPPTAPAVGRHAGGISPTRPREDDRRSRGGYHCARLQDERALPPRERPELRAARSRCAQPQDQRASPPRERPGLRAGCSRGGFFCARPQDQRASPPRQRPELRAARAPAAPLHTSSAAASRYRQARPLPLRCLNASYY
jgi:hypothetical protein